jgi:hypothetical protein
LTIEQLHLLIRKPGHNPTVFLSDPRKENLRFAMDNRLEEGHHPFQNKIQSLNLTASQYRKEISYWQPIFSGVLKRVPGFRNWHMSRTHGLVYRVKDRSEDVFYIAVHIDPKNAISVIPEIFGKRALGDKSALYYHQTAAGKGEKYLGTGLFGLGTAVFIKLLKDAQFRGTINKLDVEGENNIDTTFSIYTDDMIVKKISEIHTGEVQLSAISTSHFKQQEFAVV